MQNAPRISPRRAWHFENLELQRVHTDRGAHGAAQIQGLHISTLRSGGLRLVDGVHQSLQVLGQLLLTEGNLADGDRKSTRLNSSHL